MSLSSRLKTLGNDLMNAFAQIEEGDDHIPLKLVEPKSKKEESAPPNPREALCPDSM